MFPQIQQGLQAGHPIVFGVPGTGASPQTIWGRGRIFYVDPSNPAATDQSDGLDFICPFRTLQAAVDNPNLQNYDVIKVLSPIEESVVTPDYPDTGSYVTIQGCGNGPYSPAWESAAADEPCLSLNAVGWRVEGFRFYGPSASACIEIHHTDGSGNDIAIRTVIQNNLFDGLTVGLYGILSHGAYDVWIVNNLFQLFHNATPGGAIPLFADDTPLAIPYRNHVVGNVFWDSDNGAIFPCNGSVISGNVFQPTGYAYSMTQVLNTTVGGNPGDDNLVVGNYLPGDYSIVGGYAGGAADVWSGNYATDVAEAEVGDNGLTILPPA